MSYIYFKGGFGVEVPRDLGRGQCCNKKLTEHDFEHGFWQCRNGVKYCAECCSHVDLFDGVSMRR